jgi:hypothetical protein
MLQLCNSIVLKQCVANTSILASPISQCLTLIMFINFHNLILRFFLIPRVMDLDTIKQIQTNNVF